MQTKSSITTKNQPGNGMPPVPAEQGGSGGPVPGWSSLKDSSDPQSAWPQAVNRVAASACKDRTAAEIWRQIGRELAGLGVSSLFLTRQGSEKDLRVSNITFSSGGTAVYPAAAPRGNGARFSADDNRSISRVLSRGEMVATSEPEDSLRRLFPADDAAGDNRSFVCAPLGDSGGVSGVLVAAAPDLTHAKAQHIALLAHVASMAYYNSRLSHDVDDMREKIECLDKGFGSAVSALDKSMQDIVHALTAPMEKRDPYTFGHQMRVTRLAVTIAEEMGLARYRIDGLRLAASIHDIGKIVIPFEILNRPTRLSEAEFTLVKMHPQVAFDMLSPISFRWPVADIVRQHHERLDGSGYPLGLKGGQILLEAKVLAVADVVEAMSAHRPYRAALGIDAALDEVSARSGTLYDSEAVAACIRLLLIQNFSLEGESEPSAWQSANPFAQLKQNSDN